MIRECKHPTCGPTCRRLKEKKARRFNKKVEGDDLNRKSVPQLKEIAQDLLNALIRRRDQNKGCISCQKGQVKHAGHFHSQGRFSGVRFDVMNVNGQCDWCNTAMQGNLEEYHAGLVARYGDEAVEQLAARANVTKIYRWRRSELLELINDLKSQQT